MYTLIMATLHKRTCRGHQYWSIVESRRVNGKPRPVILEYLGTAEHLLQRLATGVPQTVKSYQHGLVAVMLEIAAELQIVPFINKYIKERQVRDDFTVGGSLLLAALGRIVQPTSKRHWYAGWAQDSSLAYLIGQPVHKLDSQHFWDQMDCLPVAAIPAIEQAILRQLQKKEDLTLDTLFYDTTNFFTYIDSTNSHCPLAQRGHNKQKRHDLRQLGLMLVVTRQDGLPLFHQVYPGNEADKTRFATHFKKIMQRLKRLAGTLDRLTLVFDQGNNSKQVLGQVVEHGYFVGALSPSQHRQLIEQANTTLQPVSVNPATTLNAYRTRQTIWQQDLTVVVYVSETLRAGQIRGVEQQLTKLWQQLTTLQTKIATPTQRGAPRTLSRLESQIKTLIQTAKVPRQLVDWELTPGVNNSFQLTFARNQARWTELTEHWYGRRILMTNRHDWSTADIIRAYWGQHHVEAAFKNMKNPFHLSLRPQFHWTDQKVTVHGFICFLAFLLGMVAFKRARERAQFTGGPPTLFEKLNSIRLATRVQTATTTKKTATFQTCYQLEVMEPDVAALAQAFGLTDAKIKKSKIPFSVYI